jgi:hypothetical protein
VLVFKINWLVFAKPLINIGGGLAREWVEMVLRSYTIERREITQTILCVGGEGKGIDRPILVIGQ